MSVKHVELQFQNLVELENGALAAAFNQELQAILEDLKDRPNVKTARKVTFELELKPECDESGMLDRLKAQFAVTSKAPSRKSRSIHLQARSLNRGGRNVQSATFVVGGEE